MAARNQMEETIMGNGTQLSSGGIDRRDFLRLSGILGVGLAAATAIPSSAEAVWAS